MLPPDAVATQAPAPALAVAIVGVGIVIAIALRVAASLGDFWLDEIWSWYIATPLKNPLDILFNVHHDNNHYLNSFVLFALGRDAPIFLYRLPAVIAGVGAVLLAGQIARKWNWPAAVAAVLLTGCSFFLVEYSSEARGYAYLMFFTLAAFATLQVAFDSPGFLWNGVLAGCAVLGFLSHLTFAFAYAALVAWSVWHNVAQNGWLSRRHLLPITFQVLIPAAFLAFLYRVDLRFMQVGGGDEGSAWQAYTQAISTAFGGPITGAASIGVAIAVTILAVIAVCLLIRTRFDLWVPMLFGVFVVPAAVLLIVRPSTPYPRYFLVNILFLQLLLSWFLGWLYQQGQGKFATAAIIAAMLIGNGFTTARLLEFGRGDFHDAVQLMLTQTAGPQVTIASDHDFRNQLVLAFYLHRARDQDRAVYIPSDRWPIEGPEWFILHNFDQNFAPPPSEKDPQGNTYTLVRAFPYAGLSGFNWALYHNANRQLATPSPSRHQ